MADVARWIRDGKFVTHVWAKTLTEEDRGEEYRCCGVGCNAQLKPQIGEERKFFAWEPGLEPHIYGCCYKESCSGKREKMISRLSKGGEGFSEEEMFKKLAQGTHRRTIFPPPTGGGGGDPKPGIDNEKGVITLKENLRLPKNFKELFALFSDFGMTTYGGTSVKEILVDGRSVSDVRKNGIEGRKIIVVTRAKPSKAQGILNKGDIFLSDAFPVDRHEKRIGVVIHFDDRKLRQEVSELIFAKNENGEWKYPAFAIWAVWESTSIPGVYKTTLQSKKLFLELEDGEYRS